MRDKKKLLFIIVILIAILLFAFYLRHNTFWIAHWKGDQEHYLALAMKLDKFGFDGYNLRGVDLRAGMIDLAVFKGQVLKGVIGELIPSKDEKGYLLQVLDEQGVKHYDKALHHVAPAFPYALMLSNKIFAKGRYTSVNQNIGKLVKFMKPRIHFRYQFYAVIVPLLFSLGLIFIVFFLGKELFSYQIGLLSAFILSVNALDLLSSQRVWGDDMAAFFLTLSVLFFVKAVRSKKALLFVISGLSCALATLTRQNMLVIIFALFIYLIVMQKKEFVKLDFKKIFLDKHFGMFLLAFVAGTFFWFYKAFQVYGNIFFMPSTEMTNFMDQTQWYDWIDERPHSIILYTVGLVCISPIFAFSFIAIKDFIQGIKNFIRNQLSALDTSVILLFFWFLAFFISFTIPYEGKEHRYLLPAYPALAILSSYVLSQLKGFLAKKIKIGSKVFPQLIICLLLGVYAWWSIRVGSEVTLSDKSLIFVPF